MRYHSDTQTLSSSATDLANHARCEHLTQLVRAREVAIAEDREQRAEVEDSMIARKGREFEDRVVAHKRDEVLASGGRFLDLRDTPRAERQAPFEHAMREGVELIAQAPLRSGSVFGFADLLVRVDISPNPGGTLGTTYRYEPVEVKFARTVKPEHLLQASAYADALATLQGELPRQVHVVTGDGTWHPHDSSEYVDYVRTARARFEAALELDVDAQVALVPEPVAHCEMCEFRARCDERRSSVDHLSLVAWIRGDQRTKLIAAGIGTLTQLATTDLDGVVGIGRGTFERLRAQARLQLDARSRELPGIEYRSPDEHDLTRRGFALLPAPDAQDMFFDFEGYPFHEDGDGLEYLWGWTTLDPAREDGLRFDHLWADDLDTENANFETFLTTVEQRRAASPGMHVYHYAPYEVTALGRIARRRSEWMDRLDDLLRAHVFVDLFAVVRQSMLIGLPSYSIKQLEPLYDVSRAGAGLADGGASIEEYERWLLTGDTGIRDMIIDYNRDDCDSTLRLRDWLLVRRDEAAARGIVWPEPVGTDEDEDPNDSPDAPRDPHADDALRARLEAVADDEALDEDLRGAARLLSAMPGWGWRIKREFIGELHARKHDRDTPDYIAEPQAIGGLELISEDHSQGNEGTVVRTYGFPEQVTTMRVGDYPPIAYDPTTGLEVGTVCAIDFDARTVDIKTTPGVQKKADAKLTESGEAPGRLPPSIVGWANIPYSYLEDVARRIALQLLAAIDSGRDPFAPGEPMAAAMSMLARQVPRVGAGTPPSSLQAPPDPDELAALVSRLHGSHLIVQGPPGTGKTYTSARLIVALVESGLRVGITSNSGEAIRNVLRGIDEYRDERATSGRPIQARAAYQCTTALGFGDDWITTHKVKKRVRKLFEDEGLDILAGTAWQFTADDLQLDVMLVDEAGQLSLLMGTAIAACTSRVVLVGDPQQLAQPSNTIHPFGCDASVLEHLFGEAAVLPPERATLLSTTRRMHPAISTFISESYYEGRLHAHPDTAEQRVVAPRAPELPTAGTHLLAVEHAGNRVRSDEEVAAIVHLVERLLDGGRVVPRPGQAEREIRREDLIVVAPYNAQRRALQEALGPDVAVGTVDKFQGQEAPIAIVSMTASSREELPRGLEFLLDPHRLNVAISRARALSVLVASPALLATSAATLHEMRLLNDLARFARVSGQAADSRSSTSSSRS